jgi:hypothetical protein
VSFRMGNVAVIVDEPDKRCELCGQIGDCRPYGPNGEQICYDCGMKNPEVTERMMNPKLFGEGNA